MVTEEEALAQVIGSVKARPGRQVPLAEAREEFSASDVYARIALPAFDNSAMDGYAVMASSCRIGGTLRVVGEQAAGVDRRIEVKPGEAVRIFTGAPIPNGADAVVMQEDVQRDADRITVNTEVAPGEFIRRRGSDLSEGQKIIATGDVIRAQMLSLLASQGMSQVEVGGNVRAAVVTTGDELIPPGQSLEPGQIYESNSVLIRGLLEKYGATVEMVERCRDDAGSIETALRKGLGCEVMVIIGGVSVGARDLVRASLTAVGVKTELWRVSVKPGKPFLFGTARTGGGCSVFGLPGNPVSAFMTFLLFVRPALLTMRGAGAEHLGLPGFDVRLGEDVQNPSERPHYVRGVVREGVFSPIGRQESYALFGLSRARAVLRVPAGAVFKAGDTVWILGID